MVKAVVGANWGDEGKGKITDMLAQDADIVVRFQGGASRHTIVNNYSKFALHTSSGVLMTILQVLSETVWLLTFRYCLKRYSPLWKKVFLPDIKVSDRAQMVSLIILNLMNTKKNVWQANPLDFYKIRNCPFYSDKFAKIGFKVSELFEDEAALREKVQNIW